MRNRNKAVLNLSKQTFDLLWAAMIALGAGSLALRSYPIALIPWLPTALLGAALALGLALTLFIERRPTEIKKERKVSPSDKPPTAPVYPRIHSTIYRYVEGYNPLEQAHPVSQHIGWAGAKFWGGSVEPEFERRFHEQWQAQITLAMRRILETYKTTSGVSRSRDLVNEAVEIAKRLQGTSLQVRVCKDGDILISEGAPSDSEDFNLSFQTLGRKKTTSELPN